MPKSKNFIAGAFPKEMFTKYVEDITSTTCLELSPDKLAALRSACVLSEHAEGRKIERYSGRMQEFLRSFTTTNDCLAVKNQRYYLFVGSKRVEISSWYDVIHVTERCLVAERHCPPTQQPLPSNAVRALVASANTWNQHILERRTKTSGAPELPLTEDDIDHLASAAERPVSNESLKVFSTTTTFVVSTDFKKLITCYPTTPSYSEWLKTMKPKSYPKGSGGRKQAEAAETMATTRQASKAKRREMKKSSKSKSKRDTKSRLKKSHR